MPDQSDVETALATMLADALYPNGTSQPSLVGSNITLMRGWPTEAQVQTAVAANTILISVHAEKGMARDTSRYFWDWRGVAGTPTITATVAGATVTFAGTNAAGHALAVRYLGSWYLYLTTSTDTLATIAADFAGQISGATASGAVLTLPGATGAPIEARVVLGGTASVEVSRQRMDFRVSVWAPTPALRDSLFGQLPGIIPYVGNRLSLPNSQVATWLGQRETGPDDVPGRANEWRRDILATYEFGVTYSVFEQALVLLQIETQPSQAAAGTAGVTTVTIDI